MFEIKPSRQITFKSCLIGSLLGIIFSISGGFVAYFLLDAYDALFSLALFIPDKLGIIAHSTPNEIAGIAIFGGLIQIAALVLITKGIYNLLNREKIKTDKAAKLGKREKWNAFTNSKDE